jgi:hypothetical protein
MVVMIGWVNMAAPLVNPMVLDTARVAGSKFR